MNIPLSCIPTKRDEKWWLDRHQLKLEQKAALGNCANIVLLGDSIVHEWEVEGAQACQEYFGAFKLLNLGYGGDRTEHLLWRIENGEIDNFNADYAMLLIGTNNAGHRHDSPGDIAKGIGLIIDKLSSKLPSTKIVLMAIFPRSRHLKKRMRIRVDKTNELIKQFADQKSIFWLNINAHFLTQDGILDEEVMPDLLHPNAKQYEVWGQAIRSLMHTIASEN